MWLQSALGRIHYLDHRPDMNVAGYLTIAKVLKVHHKTGTADVQIVNTKNTLVSAESNEGFYSARIIQSFAGYDETRKKAWGTVTPITEGSFVLLTFLDRMKNRPVIIGQIPRMDNAENVYTPFYPLREGYDGFDKQEAMKHLTVYPSQAYLKVDGESNVEFSHGSKSFFTMFSSDKYPAFSAEDGHLSFDHSDLSENIQADLPNAQKASRLLYVHRTDFDDNKTTWTKFFIDSDGTLRITRDNNDGKLTYLSMANDGTMKIRRQVDSPEHGQGTNFSEISQLTDGSVAITRTVGGSTANFNLNSTGQAVMSHSSGSQITLDKDLYMEASPTGQIWSQSLSNFVEKNHMVVSDKAPQNPQPYLLWIDTSV